MEETEELAVLSKSARRLQVAPMIEALPLQQFIDRIFPFLAAWLLFGSRFLGFAMVFPLFSWLNLSPLVRAAFAAAMAAPLAYHELAYPTFIKGINGWDLTALCSKELFIGLLIGMIGGIPFWAAQNCGELIDTYRGSSAGHLFDPSLTTETSELGAALILVALAIMIWSGGILDVLTQLYLSFQVWSAFSFLPTLDRNAALLAGGLVGRQLLMTIGFSGTILMALFAVDLGLALMGRSTRQVQVFDISMVLKNLALALLLPLIGGALLTLIAREVTRGSFNIDALRQLLPVVTP
jgi:type III secretion protein T